MWLLEAGALECVLPNGDVCATMTHRGTWFGEYYRVPCEYYRVAGEYHRVAGEYPLSGDDAPRHMVR